MKQQHRNTPRRQPSGRQPARRSANKRTPQQGGQPQMRSPQRRPSTPVPVERTLRSSEKINRIREQGAKRTQVAAPKHPVNEAGKRNSANDAARKTVHPGAAPKRAAARPSQQPGNSRARSGAQTRKNAQPRTSTSSPSRRGKAPAQRSTQASKRQPSAAKRARGSVGQGQLANGIYSGTNTQGNRGARKAAHGSPAPYQAKQPRAPKKKRFLSARKLAVASVFALAVLVAVGVDSLVNGNKIYSGVTIGDVQVQGLTKDEAIERVSSGYSERVSSNVAMFFTSQENLDNPKTSDSDANIEEQISYEESLSNRTQWTVPASTVDASLDVDSLVEEAFEAGRQQGGIFGRIKAALFGWNVPLTCSYDDAQVSSLADEMTSAVGSKRVNYDISISDGVASVTGGNDGNEITAEWLTSHLNSTFLGSDATTKTVLETQYMPLQSTERDAQSVADTVNASISQGATFTYEDQTWNASAADLGNLVTTYLSGEGDHWKLVPVFDESKTKNALFSSLHSNIDSNGLEVSFDKDSSGTITVSSNAKGQAPKADEVLSNLNSSFFVTDSRTQTPQIEVPSAEIPSSLSFDDAKSFGLITDISSFTTQYSSGKEARVHNIHTAADLLSNSIAKANGGTWSFNDTAGEATPDKGYEAAGAIVGGEYSDAVGGGICQVATTVFNSVYLAGYPVEKRYNHTLYIESYPKGRDAAIAYPDLDLVWKNDTASDVLLVMTYTSTSVTATLWGVDPGYQVSTEYGEWQKGQPYSTTYRTDKTVASGKEYVETTGVDGSSITIVRTVKSREGKVLHEDSFTSTYAPKNKVIVKGTA